MAIAGRIGDVRPAGRLVATLDQGPYLCQPPYDGAADGVGACRIGGAYAEFRADAPIDGSVAGGGIAKAGDGARSGGLPIPCVGRTMRPTSGAGRCKLVSIMPVRSLVIA